MPFYGVQKGRDGAAVYTSWEECERVTKGFPGAKFKRFDMRQDAEKFAFKTAQSLPDESYDALIYTDGSFLQNRKGGYAAVFITNQKPYGVICGPSSMPAVIRNVGGEIEAAEEAISKAIELGYRTIKILHDYEGVGAWANEEWERTKPSTIQYHAFIQEKRTQIHIDFEKVEGHSGNQFNDVADIYAKKGAMSDCKMVLGFGEPFTIEHSHSVPKEVDMYVCPECGSAVKKNDGFCKMCGIIFSKDNPPVLKSKKDMETCYNCGSAIPAEKKYSVQIYLYGKKHQVSCCCEECAKEVVDKEVERIALAYDEIASQEILVQQR